MAYKIISASEDDTGDALFSEALSIPMIIRGTPNVALAKGGSSTKLLDADVIIPLPTLSDAKPMASLMSGTIFGRLGIPEIIK